MILLKQNQLKYQEYILKTMKKLITITMSQLFQIKLNSFIQTCIKANVLHDSFV